MYRILQIMSDTEVQQCRQIAASAPFVDGKISNPHNTCLLYTSPSPRDPKTSRMPSSA